MLRRLACAWLLVPLLASAQGTDDWKKQLAEASKKSVEVANATMASYLAKQGIPVALTLAVERDRAGYQRPTTNRYQRHERAVYLDLGMDRTPYTCAVIGGDLRSTDVEHIVALAEAHDSGLPATMMLAFSGDPLNLTVAMPRENRVVKSAKDAADYLPPRNSCWFAARVLAVKARWGLTVDRAEAEALLDALAGCDVGAMQRPSC